MKPINISITLISANSSATRYLTQTNIRRTKITTMIHGCSITNIFTLVVEAVTPSGIKFMVIFITLFVSPSQSRP